MSCSVFERFHPPPPAGWVTLREQDCTLHASPSSDQEERDRADVSVTANITQGLGQTTFQQHQGVYGDILVGGDGRTSVLEADASPFLSPKNESHWKVAWNLWWETGFMAALQSLQTNTDNKDNGTGAVLKLAERILSFAKTLQSVYGYLTSRPQMETVEMISKYSNLPNWGDSAVRALALHPRLNFLALARQNDEVDVRNLVNGEQRVVLKDRQQVNISCLQWAPHCDSLLAVGAGTGILLWYIDPTSPATRFVTTWVRFESSPGHTPVSSLSWSPWGNFIVSSSPGDNNLMLWDVPLGVATRVRRGKGGGVARVAWSPDGKRVFAANVSSVFRVWETATWTCERWSNFSGRCKCACWSPGGDMLVFALEGDPSLYYLRFGDEASSGSPSAIKCADLSPCMLQGPDKQTIVGGEVQDMVWDATGQRLAVTFTSASSSAHLVALFRTRIGQLLEVLPGGFIQGAVGEHPVVVCFQPGCSVGALLSVVWSSGRISFIPLYFQSPASSSPEDVFSYRHPGLSPLEPISISHTSSPHPNPLSPGATVNESLNRPALSRTYGVPSNNGTPLYSVIT